MKLVWNAIVKNESAIIQRCLDSIMPHVDGAIVLDTGSTDNTIAMIHDAFTAANKPVFTYRESFVDFEKSRNSALKLARSNNLPWDYLLLSDADMELKVERSDWLAQLNGGASYDMRQVGGSLSYHNRRILNRSAAGDYVGVTHEYLDVPAAGSLDGAYFVDHADGSNRPSKSERDIALLEAALATEDRPGLVQRYTFYLASAYFDKGDWSMAAAHYSNRVALGGFDEERWYAQRQYALCLRNMNDALYATKALEAYSGRPQRKETLYDLARYYRERGENHTSLLFSEAGLAQPFPKDDKLFVDTYAHKTGLEEEFAICAYYDPRRRRQGARICNKLALQGNGQASVNLFWYLQPLAVHIPSYKSQQISFDPPAGYVAMNPSVINHAGTCKILVRTVNYQITDDGRYVIRDGGAAIDDLNPIRTRNYLSDPDCGFCEIKLPLNWPAPRYLQVRGFEDSRIFAIGDEIWSISNVRELTYYGWCEQVLAPIRWYDGDLRYGDDRMLVLPQPRRHEKNWMPWVKDGELCFVYRLGTLIDMEGNELVKLPPNRWKVDHVSGGSQVVEVDARTFVALVHEAGTIPGRSNRYYRHRFVVFDAHGRLNGISAPFYFQDLQIEFAAGLAYFPEKRQLMASFGVRDCEAWTATMNVDEVIEFVYKDALL